MYPILFEYKTLQISSYGLMLMMAFLICNYLLKRYLLSINENPKVGDDIIFYAAFGGILGAKIYYLLEQIVFYSDYSNIYGINKIFKGIYQLDLSLIFSGINQFGSGLVFLGGLIGGMLSVTYYVKKNNLDLETMLTILCGCAIGALFGSFILNLILFGQQEFLTKLYHLDFNGMSVVGGISGGFIGVEIAKKIVGYKDYTGDLFVIPILIGHTIGRLGCLLGGCCFGMQCKLPWGIIYPKNSPAYFHQIQNKMAILLVQPNHPLLC